MINYFSLDSVKALVEVYLMADSLTHRKVCNWNLITKNEMYSFLQDWYCISKDIGKTTVSVRPQSKTSPEGTPRVNSANR